MSYCINCGNELEEEALFCSKCGNKVIKNIDENTNVGSSIIHTDKPKSKNVSQNNGQGKKWQVLLITIIWIAIAAIIGFTVGMHKSTKAENSSQEIETYITGNEVKQADIDNDDGSVDETSVETATTEEAGCWIPNKLTINDDGVIEDCAFDLNEYGLPTVIKYSEDEDTATITISYNFDDNLQPAEFYLEDDDNTKIGLNYDENGKWIGYQGYELINGNWEKSVEQISSKDGSKETISDQIYEDGVAYIDKEAFFDEKGSMVEMKKYSIASQQDDGTTQLVSDDLTYIEYGIIDTGEEKVVGKRIYDAVNEKDDHYEEYEFDDNGHCTWHRTYAKDENGNKIWEVNDERITRYYTDYFYIYDGDHIIKKEFYKDNICLGWINYSYDENGNVISFEECHDDGDVYREWNMQYEYVKQPTEISKVFKNALLVDFIDDDVVLQAMGITEYDAYRSPDLL